MIEFDGLLSANTLVEFLLDVSADFRAESQLPAVINISASLCPSVCSCWRSQWR